MKVSKVLTLAEYFRNSRFKDKKPSFCGNWRRRQGDNIYHRLSPRDWHQLPGPHELRDAQKDLAGKNAVISTHYYYFGASAIPLPRSLQTLIAKTQGHRSRFPNHLIKRFTTWITRHRPGIHGTPTDT